MATSNLYRGGEKIQDPQRIQKVLDDLTGTGKPEQRGRQPLIIDEDAKKMLMEYTVELASSVIEAANALSKHRGSQTIEPDDVNLILAKKLGIELPGQQRIRSLHQHNLKSLYTPPAGQASTTSNTAVGKSSAVVDTRRQSVKRKLNS